MAIGWIFIGALLGGLAAQVKGFSMVGGLIGGSLLGPLALLMFLCSDGRKKCPQCAERVQKDAKLCPHCKSQL
jgi:hypothetical protein